ncbi:MAG: hypothetical protein K0Q79_1410 [Flavipsychrobacter sp.]|jgi:hypothetical protein|nr:hypothetical protein [Flavipsychrobacter sp.]
MRIYFLIISFFIYASSFAQRKGFNRIELHYVPRYYLDKLNVDNVNVAPNPIRPHNTLGHAFGLAYERVTRYGLLIDGGMQFGIRKHNIDIVYDVSDYDPDAKNVLKGKVYRDNFKFTLYDINPYFFIGYRRSINKKWAAVVKAGCAEKRFLWQGYRAFVQPTSITYFVPQFGPPSFYFAL